MKRESLILCLVGPAGSGKTSNMQKLLQEFPGNLKNSISVTTRPKRDSEKPGETREFVSIPEFQKLIAEDALFEFEEIHAAHDILADFPVVAFLLEILQQHFCRQAALHLELVEGAGFGLVENHLGNVGGVDLDVATAELRFQLVENHHEAERLLAT